LEKGKNALGLAAQEGEVCRQAPQNNALSGPGKHWADQKNKLSIFAHKACGFFYVSSNNQLLQVDAGEKLINVLHTILKKVVMLETGSDQFFHQLHHELWEVIGIFFEVDASKWAETGPELIELNKGCAFVANGLPYVPCYYGVGIVGPSQ